MLTCRLLNIIKLKIKHLVRSCMSPPTTRLTSPSASPPGITAICRPLRCPLSQRSYCPQRGGALCVTLFFLGCKDPLVLLCCTPLRSRRSRKTDPVSSCFPCNGNCGRRIPSSSSSSLSASSDAAIEEEILDPHLPPF